MKIDELIEDNDNEASVARQQLENMEVHEGEIENYKQMIESRQLTADALRLLKDVFDPTTMNTLQVAVSHHPFILQRILVWREQFDTLFTEAG